MPSGERPAGRADPRSGAFTLDLPSYLGFGLHVIAVVTGLLTILPLAAVWQSGSWSWEGSRATPPGWMILFAILAVVVLEICSRGLWHEWRFERSSRELRVGSRCFGLPYSVSLARFDEMEAVIASGQYVTASEGPGGSWVYGVYLALADDRVYDLTSGLGASHEQCLAMARQVADYAGCAFVECAGTGGVALNRHPSTRKLEFEPLSGEEECRSPRNAARLAVIPSSVRPNLTALAILAVALALAAGACSRIPDLTRTRARHEPVRMHWKTKDGRVHAAPYGPASGRGGQ